MNPINFALRRPKKVMVLLFAVVLTGISVVRPRSVDDWLGKQGIDLPLKRTDVQEVETRLTLKY